MESENELRVNCWLEVGRYVIPQVSREFLQKSELRLEERDSRAVPQAQAMARSLDIVWT